MVTGVWMNLSTIPVTTNINDLVLPEGVSISPRGITSINTVQVAPIVVFLGYAYQAAVLVTTGISAKNAYDTCKQTLGGSETVYKCLEGVFSTAIAFGGASSAAKKLLGKAGRVLMPHRFAADGTFDMTMNVLPYNRRAINDGLTEIDDQMQHEYEVLSHLRSLSHRDMPEPEFLGYADADHRFSKRGEGKHPAIPIYRFEHFKLGSMEIATRDTYNGTWFTLAYAGHPTHLLGERRKREYIALAKRDEYYKHELLTSGAVEARFDTEAQNADPADLTADAQGLFNTFEGEVECAIGDSYPDGSVFSVQMFDQTNQATFGFGSIAVYNSDADADSIETFESTAQLPLPQPSC
jgi:hypothetical protein